MAVKIREVQEGWIKLKSGAIDSATFPLSRGSRSDSQPRFSHRQEE